MSKLRTYLYQVWGPPIKDGGEHLTWRCPAPDCPDKSGHFRVLFVEEEFAIGRCHRCGYPPKGAGYDICRILAEQEGISRRKLVTRLGIGREYDPEEASLAVAAFAREMGFADPFEGGLEEKPDSMREETYQTKVLPPPKAPPSAPRPTVIPREPGGLDHGTYGLFLNPLEAFESLGRECLAYLEGRKLSEGLIAKYGIRYCDRRFVEGPVWKPKPEMKGWTLGERMHARVIFPIFFRGRVMFYQGRDIYEEKPGDKYYKKYLNPVTGTDVEVQPTDILMGFDESQGCETLVVVEGPVCWIKVLEVGFGCVAMLGKGLQGKREELLKEIAPKRIVLFFDPDVPAKERDNLVQVCRRVAPTSWTQSESANKDPGAMEPEEIRYTVGRGREFGFLDRIGWLTSTGSR